MINMKVKFWYRKGKAEYDWHTGTVTDIGTVYGIKKVQISSDVFKDNDNELGLKLFSNDTLNMIKAEIIK